MSTLEPGYCLDISGSHWPVILPLAVLQIPFAVLLSRNFIKGPPDANL
jgi:raffinose/stachyose/melibiose transport system permease protein